MMQNGGQLVKTLLGMIMITGDHMMIDYLEIFAKTRLIQQWDPKVTLGV